MSLPNLPAGVVDATNSLKNFDVGTIQGALPAVSTILPVASQFLPAKDFSKAMDILGKAKLAYGHAEDIKEKVSSLKSKVKGAGGLKNAIKSIGKKKKNQKGPEYIVEPLGNEKDKIRDKFFSLFPSGEISRQNKFEVGLISTPSFLNGLGMAGIDINKVFAKCFSVSAPQRSLQTTNIAINGPELKIPYAASYDPIALSFYSDEKYDTRRFFEFWQSNIINIHTNYSSYYKDFVGKLHIGIMGRDGNIKYGVILEDVYPMNISTMEYAFGSNNSYQVITVTLNYSKWYEDVGEKDKNMTPIQNYGLAAAGFPFPFDLSPKTTSNEEKK